MSLSFVIDMNLSPEWVLRLATDGFAAVHWSEVGPAVALDVEIMDWATAASRVVMTNDMDFGNLLALTNLKSPSVVLLRGAKLLPESLGVAVITAVRLHEASLSVGAMVVVDVDRSRVRLLPFHPEQE